MMAGVQTSMVAGLRVRRGGQGYPLLLLHGWAMSGAVFGELLSNPPSGLGLIAIDLPGHGGSTTAAEGSLSVWAERIETTIRELALPSWSLLGWSLGGMLALQLAGRGNLCPERLLLVATTPRFTAAEDWSAGLPLPQLRAMQRDLKRAFRPTLEGFFQLLFATDEIDRKRYRQIARFAVGPDLLPDEGSAADGLRILQREDLRPLVEAISVPTLVMHGDCDEVIPVAAGEWLAANLPAARLERFPRVGHAPFFSSPGIFLRLIGDFCR